MSANVDPNQFGRCNKCGAILSPQTAQCPHCGAPTAETKPRSSLIQRLGTWRHFRHFLVAMILLLLPHVPYSSKIFPYRLLFPTSPLVSEAVTRANQHPEAAALLGRPISAGWLSRGYVWSDETGWSEGKMWIPLTGSNSSATLYARGGRADSPWVFSELSLTHDDGRVLNLLAPIAQPSLLPLASHVRIYIVPLGKVMGLGLDELPEFYRKQYGLTVKVVTSIPLEADVRNTARDQLIFEELVKLMRRHFPKLAQDKSTYLIGVTDEDMYMRDRKWNFAYTSYSPYYRAGVVSSHRFVPRPLSGNEVLLRARIRKMISRTMGFVVFDLPRSEDPSSVMYKDLYGSSSADLMSDRFEGLGAQAVVDEFKTGHGIPPQPAEILPQTANFDYSKVDGRYPCLRVTRRKSGSLDAALTKCARGVHIDAGLDEIEVDLRGNLITRTSDLFLPGNVPISATRCYRAWDQTSRAFGWNTALSWDLYPIGSRQPYTYLEIIPCDGNSLRYERISKGTGYADAVYEHRTTNTPFLGSRISWNGNGWDLKLRNGALYVFPESYYGKKGTDGALIEFRDAKAQNVKIERSERRNLKKLSAPDKRWISFEHDTADRIMTADDYQGRKVTYLYDHGGRLAEVRGVTSNLRYFYGGTYLTKIEINGVPAADFEYDETGRIGRLNLIERGLYKFHYEYDRAAKKNLTRTIVTGPDGSATKFEMATR
jgi:predicted Zn-dependent protease